MDITRTVGSTVTGVAEQARTIGGTVTTIARTGLLAPVRPDKLARMGAAFLRYGPTLAAALAVGAVRCPDRIAVIDDAGQLTYAEIAAQARALGAGLRELGVQQGDQVGVLLRNGRHMVITLAALSHVGADALLLNTGFAGPQAAEVMERHDAKAVIHDQEFLDIVDDAAAGRLRVVGWVETAVGEGATCIDELIEKYAGADPGKPGRESKLIILTSGTTGTPKGAARGGSSTAVAASLLDGMPLKAGDTTVIACPIFHAWGLANLAVALVLECTLVLPRKFDPERTLALIEETGAAVLAVVPVMLQRMADLPEDVRQRYDVRSLRVVGSSGSALPGDLPERFMDAFGDVIYSLYGSTEVGYVSVASPRDLRSTPGTAGRVIRNVKVELLDDNDRAVQDGEVGRIFIGSPLLIDGYTGGGDKKRVRGLMSSGDMGCFDGDGRLQVTGRDDDMIVSGGENVFPGEVENLLASQPEIEEAAVLGVPDEKFGQRLVAFVVTRQGQQLDAETVRGRVKKELANYKVPREVVFLDELPRNATGKVLKRELKQVGADRGGDTADSGKG